VAMSCRSGLPQRRGWRCSARDGSTTTGRTAQGRGDGGDALHWSDVTALSNAGVGRRLYLFKVFCRPPSRGTTWGSYESGWHSVTELTLAFPHSAKDDHTGQVGETTPGCDSQAVSEGRRGGDSPFDPGARGVPEHLMLWSGEWARRRESGAALSGAENRPRGR
jgi:hypothetical protein